MVKRADIVAERTLYRRDENGAWQPLRIAFERPRKQPAGEWGCRYTIDGLEKSARPATKLVFGVDAVQALDLARALVERILMHSRAFADGRLAWSPTSEPHRLGTLLGPTPHANLTREKIVRSELVRTVELELDWPLPCVLRIEVLERMLSQKERVYWTRVWRTDSYRMHPTASAAVSGRRRGQADETILVEDSMFSELGAVLEWTPEAAIEATTAKIRWQLFTESEPKNKGTTAPKRVRRRRESTKR